MPQLAALQVSSSPSTSSSSRTLWVAIVITWQVAVIAIGAVFFAFAVSTLFRNYALAVHQVNTFGRWQSGSYRQWLLAFLRINPHAFTLAAGLSTRCTCEGPQQHHFGVLVGRHTWEFIVLNMVPRSSVQFTFNFRPCGVVTSASARLSTTLS